jgi:hypothetical protein
MSHVAILAFSLLGALAALALGGGVIVDLSTIEGESGPAPSTTGMRTAAAASYAATATERPGDDGSPESRGRPNGASRRQRSGHRLISGYPSSLQSPVPHPRATATAVRR